VTHYTKFTMTIYAVSLYAYKFQTMFNCKQLRPVFTILVILAVVCADLVYRILPE